MPVPITALYAGLLALVGLVLGASSGWLRAKTGVSLGAGDNPQQLVAFRRHGNFSEWVPVALILIAVLELNGVSSTALHAFGATLFLARIAHPLGLKPESTSGLPRALGAGATALVVLVAAVWAIATYF